MLTIDSQFWLKVWPRGDCWEWRGNRMPNGYGRFSDGRDWVLAHRYAYHCAKGAIPVGLEIDHLCRHRWCVRPSHLEVVTSRVNTLRGDAPPARLAKMITCQRGHLLPDRRIGKVKPQRKCLECRRLNARASYARNRERELARMKAYYRRKKVEPR